MGIFTDITACKKFRGKYVYFDNDFLGQLFQDEELFTEFTNLLERVYFLVDPLVEFEFLRDVFLPEQRILKESFLKGKVFNTAQIHPETFKKLQDNALLRSKIYSHQGQKKGNVKPDASFIDLMLGARLMLNQNHYLLTGNKKDFPRFLFDTHTVLNIEQEGDGTMRAYTVLSFSKKKFVRNSNELKKLEKKYAARLGEEIPF